MVTWADIVSLGRDLPEVEESTSYGRPALKIRGKTFVSLRSSPDALVVSCDVDEKPFLIEARKNILFETPHYEGYPAMLVSLNATIDDVREFVLDSYVLAAPENLAESIGIDG